MWPTFSSITFNRWYFSWISFICSSWLRFSLWVTFDNIQEREQHIWFRSSVLFCLFGRLWEFLYRATTWFSLEQLSLIASKSSNTTNYSKLLFSISYSLISLLQCWSRWRKSTHCKIGWSQKISSMNIGMYSTCGVITGPQLQWWPLVSVTLPL